MIDLTGVPMPDDMPEPGACVRVERLDDGLVRIVLDPPHRSRAVLDVPLLNDLDAVITTLRDDADVRGVILTGRAPDEFAVGADVHAIDAITDAARLKRLVMEVHDVFRRFEMWKVPKVAAVGGPVPGGAYELALCCNAILATDSDVTRIGLPETQLGIIPAWGGTHRLPRRIGVPAALQAILTGRLYRASQALRLGMIDRVTKSAWLDRVAREMLSGRGVRRRGRGAKAWLVDRNPAATALAAKAARKSVMAKTHGHYPAPLAVIDLVASASRTPASRWAEREATVAAELATGPVCKNLISLFFASEAAKKLGKRSSREDGPALERAAVLGAGVMGGAIASLFAERGVATRLVDLQAEAVDRALVDHRKAQETRLKRRRALRHEVDAAVDHLDGATSLSGLARTQLVVEAVSERLDVKRAVLADVCAQVASDAIVATNTSSLPVAEIAASLPHPERVVGMHFFNPVKKMPLVEVVRADATSEDVVADVARAVLALGKKPVVVRDVPGFLVNRVLGPYLDEAVRLFEAGADAVALDRAAVAFGMPMGPLALLDEVGFDVAIHAGETLATAYGARMVQSEALTRLATPARLGKKSGLGFYRHARGAAPAFDEAARTVVTTDSAAELGPDVWVDRMILAMVNEAIRCLEEGVVEHPRDLDLAMVFGTGFAPFRGGVLRFADTLGASEVVRRLEAIASSPDVSSRPGGPERFAPAARLVECARSETLLAARVPTPV